MTAGSLLPMRCSPAHTSPPSNPPPPSSSRHRSIVAAHAGRREVTVAAPPATDGGGGGAGGPRPPHVFTFDAAWGADAIQADVYAAVAPIVDSVLDGFNGTIFAYGQTGAGKSHTMEGGGAGSGDDDAGVIPRSFRHIFDVIAARAAPGRQALVRASYLEIYNEDVRDLLTAQAAGRAASTGTGGGGGGGGLELKEHPESGVYVKDLTSCVVKSPAEIEAILAAGRRNRATGATLMNAHSSRSHSIFTVTVETSEPGADGAPHIRAGKLHMVDLAGSERQSKTGATGARLKEATKINLSLSALGNVISALVDGKATHIPYRDSKLTRLLQDSLGGNTKTVMIANCGPADFNYDETLSTLRYASRAKNIKNRPRVNEDPKDAMLREFQEEIARLRARLAEEEAKARQTAAQPPSGDGVGGGGEGGGGRITARSDGADAHAARRERAPSSGSGGDSGDTAQLEADLATRAAAHEEALREKQQLAAELAALQEKLLEGGRDAGRAERREEELRRAQAELEQRRQQEAALARELEEANVMIEEQYASMAEELAAKTNKLGRVWDKLQRCQQEIADLTDEFQLEREDLLGMVRQLHKELKLKHTILEEFVPRATADQVRQRCEHCSARNSSNIFASRTSTAEDLTRCSPLMLPHPLHPPPPRFADRVARRVG
jgi:kinesin family member 3B